MVNNLQVCMNDCKLIMQKISNQQRAEMQALVMKNMATIQAKYMMQIMDSFSKKDMVGIVKIVRIIIKDKDFKGKFSSLLDDISFLYKKNQTNVNEIIKCFLTHCNSEAIELLYEVFELVNDLFVLLNDKVIKEKLEVVQKHFIENIIFAKSLLSKKSNTKSLEDAKKSNTKSLEGTKKPNVPKRASPKKNKI
jgi:hypothetical protein